MKKFFLSLFFLLFIIAGCKKEILVPNNGIYRGVFKEIFNESDTLAGGVVYLVLWENSNTFLMVGDSLTGAPASHGGTYFIQDESRIIYKNTQSVESQYDSDHYLDTTYSYFFDDESFEFSFDDGTTLYEYKLKRD